MHACVCVDVTCIILPVLLLVLLTLDLLECLLTCCCPDEVIHCKAEDDSSKLWLAKKRRVWRTKKDFVLTQNKCSTY